MKPRDGMKGGEGGGWIAIRGFRQKQPRYADTDILNSPVKGQEALWLGHGGRGAGGPLAWLWGEGGGRTILTPPRR